MTEKFPSALNLELAKITRQDLVEARKTLTRMQGWEDFQKYCKADLKPYGEKLVKNIVQAGEWSRILFDASAEVELPLTELPLTEEILRDIVGSNKNGGDWVQDDPGPETEPCSHAVEVSDVALRNLSQASSKS